MKWWTNLSDRDRRAVALLALAGVLMLGYRYFSTGSAAVATGGIDSVPAAERRLETLRRITSTLPAKEAALKQLDGELARREKNVLSSSTAAQAGARLLEVARRIGSARGIEIRGGDFSAPKNLGDSYGEVYAGISFDCRIDQYLLFFADLSREADLVAPSMVSMGVSDVKNKRVSVRMTLAGVVPRKLVPEKKGYGL